MCVRAGTWMACRREDRNSRQVHGQHVGRQAGRQAGGGGTPHSSQKSRQAGACLACPLTRRMLALRMLFTHPRQLHKDAGVWHRSGVQEAGSLTPSSGS